MITAWSLLQVSFAFAIAGWSTGAASTPAPSRVALDDVFATMRSMTVLTMPEGDTPKSERVSQFPSLACSRLQYSISNRSVSDSE